MEEIQELRDMKLKFQEILAGLKPSTNNSIEERARREKLKKGVQTSAIKMANVIVEEYLVQINGICKITDAAYAMGRNIEERMGIKKNDYQKKQKKRKQKDRKNRERAKRYKNNGCANCKRDIPQKNAKKSNTGREKKY